MSFLDLLPDIIEPMLVLLFGGGGAGLAWKVLIPYLKRRAEHMDYISVQAAKVESMESQLAGLKSDIERSEAGREALIAELHEERGARDEQRDEQREQISKLLAAYEQQTSKLAVEQERNRLLEADKHRATEEIRVLKKELAEKNEVVKKLDSNVANLDEQMKAIRSDLARMNEHNLQLRVERDLAVDEKRRLEVENEAMKLAQVLNEQAMAKYFAIIRGEKPDDEEAA